MWREKELGPVLTWAHSCQSRCFFPPSVCPLRLHLCLSRGFLRGRGRTERPRTGSWMDIGLRRGPVWAPLSVWCVTNQRLARTCCIVPVSKIINPRRLKSYFFVKKIHLDENVFSPLGCTAIVHKGCRESLPPCLKVSVVLWPGAARLHRSLSSYQVFIRSDQPLPFVFLRNRINMLWRRWRTGQPPSHRVSLQDEGQRSHTALLSSCCRKLPVCNISAWLLSWFKCRVLMWASSLSPHRLHSERHTSAVCDPHLHLSSCHDGEGEEGHGDPVKLFVWKFPQQWQVSI